jgi:PhnB protein
MSQNPPYSAAMAAIAQRVIPMLSYEDVGRAADWIVEVFGFGERERYADDDGIVYLGYASRDFRGPERHAEECEAARRWRETPYVVDGVMVHVDDVDGHFEQARSAGATILSELEDNPYAGQRQYRAEDLEGHRWMFAQLT